MTSDNYVCSLSEASLKKAREELNEDPKERLGAVQTFREWMLQQPHLKCPTDTKYLLRFLRLAHFSQLEARKVMEKYLRNKTECPEWLDNIDPMEKRLNNFLKTGYAVSLPGTNDEGRKVILVRPAKVDLACKDYDSTIMLRSFFLYISLFLNDENIQVSGFEMYVDWSHMTHAYTTYISLEENKRLMGMLTGGVPVRCKLFHFYNGGPIFDAFIALLKPFMPKKMTERLRFHGNNLENVYKYIPQRMMPDEYLPDDYTGPSAGPVDKLLETVLTEMDDENVRKLLLDESKPEYGADESKRPKDIPAASFRRLNID